MRKVERDWGDVPALLLSNDVKNDLKSVIIAKNPKLIQSTFYRGLYTDDEGEEQSEICDKLNIYYHNKCVYCESTCKQEIEHFRPKSKCNSGIKTKTEIGYYWLCYEWSNLLPSCHDCNNAKGIKFPVKGKRAPALALSDGEALPEFGFIASEQIYVDEEAWLLNPEIDNPEDFLGIEIDPSLNGINIKGLDGDNMRGEQTIAICDLNRTDLQLRRLASLDVFVKAIDSAFLLLKTNVIQNDKLESVIFVHFGQFEQMANSDKTEYSLIYRYAFDKLEHFNSIFGLLFEPSQSRILEAAFTKYKNR